MRILALVAAALIAACSPAGNTDGAKDTTSAQPSGPPVFPNLNIASYRMEATTTDPASGRTGTMVQYRSGANVRMEMPSATVVLNPGAQQAFTITHAGGRTVAMRMPLDNDLAKQFWQADPASLSFVGPCSVLGEIGTEWAHTDEDGRSTGCVTVDGILLRATKDGKTTWETTSLQRGPQDQALFTAPAGVQVMDLGNAMAKMGKAP